MHDLLGLSFSFLLFTWLGFSCLRRTPQEVKVVVKICLLSHALSAVAMILLSLYVYPGDMGAYFRLGKALVEGRAGFGGATTYDLLRALCGSTIPTVICSGSSTGSMIAASALLQTCLGTSILTVTIVFSTGAICGQWLIFSGLNAYMPPACQRPLAYGTLLVPSVVFWTSAILKESTAVFGLGLLVWGSLAFARKPSLRAGFACGMGAVIVALFKAYVLLPCALALGAWVGLRRVKARGRGLSGFGLILGAAMSIALVVLVAQAFPRYDPANFTEEAEKLQRIGQRVRGGSTFMLSKEPLQGTSSLVAAAPLAVLTALFRPFPWEAGNVFGLIGGFEAFAFLLLFLRAISKNGAKRCFVQLLASPELLACFVFSLTLAIGVGLTTTNMGTLSRYRVPMLPFYATCLLVLNGKSEASSS